jgi:hypothetical protein
MIISNENNLQTAYQVFVDGLDTISNAKSLVPLGFEPTVVRNAEIRPLGNTIYKLLS